MGSSRFVGPKWRIRHIIKYQHTLVQTVDKLAIREYSGWIALIVVLHSTPLPGPASSALLWVEYLFYSTLDSGLSMWLNLNNGMLPNGTPQADVKCLCPVACSLAPLWALWEDAWLACYKMKCIEQSWVVPDIPAEAILHQPTTSYSQTWEEALRRLKLLSCTPNEPITQTPRQSQCLLLLGLGGLLHDCK